MAISSISSQVPYLSLLNYMDDSESEDSNPLLDKTGTGSSGNLLASLAGDNSNSSGSTSNDVYGMASVLGLSAQARAALGLSATTPTTTTPTTTPTGTGDSPESTAPDAAVQKKVVTALAKGGANGQAFAAALDTVMKDVTTEGAVSVRDQVLGLIAQLKDPTLNSNASSAGSRTTRTGNTSVLTLSGSQGAVLRLESSSNSSDGSTSLRLTYSGKDLGAVDLHVTRGTDAEDKPTLTASVEQRKVLARGRLSDPVSSDEYNGPI